MFNEILYRPFLNIAVALYNLIPGTDFGIAIVVLTILVNILLMPLRIKATRSQRKLQQLQPKIKEIQEKFKDNREAQAAATMQLYKDHNVNLLSGCLPLLIQLPVAFALYKAVTSGLNSESLALLYPFVENPGTISTVAFGLIDMTKRSVPLALAAGILQYFQARLMAGRTSPDKDPSTAAMNRSMLYVFPAIIMFMGLSFPAGLTIYFITSTLVGILEHWHINRTMSA